MSGVMVPKMETIRLEADGRLTLPPWVLQAFALQPRQELVVLPVGEALLLIPRQSVVLEASQAISRILMEEGVTREGLLADLLEERQQYNRERYPELYE
jgi:hypothetical protein